MWHFCILLDGTNAHQCRYEGPYKFQNRGKPSLARVCFGRAEVDSRGPVNNIHFLQCEPAEEVVGHKGQSDTIYTAAWLIEQQRRCTRYKEI